MNLQEGWSMNKEIDLIPVLVKPREYPFGMPIKYWLFLFGITGLMLYGALESFFSSGVIWPAIFISVFLLLLLQNWLETEQQKRRAVFLENYVFPPAIRSELAKRYPHLSDEQLTLVIQGLRQYFQLCNAAGQQMLSMPSRVVDVAWHEFILLTRSYADFCRNGLGRFLHHTPASEMETPEAAHEGLKAAWQYACKWEELDPQSSSRLPFLFAIDTALNIPDGIKHSLDNNYATDTSGACGSGGCGGGCGGG